MLLVNLAANIEYCTKDSVIRATRLLKKKGGSLKHLTHS